MLDSYPSQVAELFNFHVIKAVIDTNFSLAKTCFYGDTTFAVV